MRLAGLSEWALRFPSVFFGVLMIPLAYALGRRLFGRVAGNLAALLAALHPLWLYYSQEARMYTLLTALGMLAGYALLRVLAAGYSQNGYPKRRLAWWTALVVTAIALLYTHYFAAFLLAAFGLYFLRRAVKASAAAPTPAADRGTGRGRCWRCWPTCPGCPTPCAASARTPATGKALSSWTRPCATSPSASARGETVLEQQAVPLAWAVAALAVVCLAALLWTSFRVHRSSFIVHRSSILFVLLYLLVPIISILLLSASTPKFNPRYLMLASPALVLLLAGGLSLPFRHPLTR